MMISKEECSILAASTYNDARGTPNQLDFTGMGWVRIAGDSDLDHPISGLTIAAYQRGTEIVIACKGTDFLPDSDLPRTASDVIADLALGVGLSSIQIYQAALFYEDVKAANPGAQITFTGHSLGAGLASILSVWFNRPAILFANAPFEATALNIRVMYSVAAYLALHLYVDADFATFMLTYPLTYSGREEQITNYYVQGEFLQARLGFLSFVGGKGVPFNIEDSEKCSDLTLHSVALHSALTLSPLLVADSQKLTTLIARIMDSNLYATKLESRVPDFLSKLLQSQIPEFASTDSGKLSLFAKDMKVLGDFASSLPAAGQNALISQAIEWYYQDAVTGNFFKGVEGGLLQYTIATGEGIDGAANKAAAYVDKWLTPILKMDGILYSRTYAAFEQWNVVAATGATNGTALDGSKSQIFIGGAGNDSFTGGDKSDVLFGGRGADSLAGGRGHDTIIGGADADTMDGGLGYDRYRIDGNDTIYDADQFGSLEDKTGRPIAGVIEKHSDGTYTFLADPSISVSGDESGITLFLAGGDSVTLKGFHSDGLGLLLRTESQPVNADRTIAGDLAPKDMIPSTPALDTQTDELGNIITDPNTPQPDRDDFLYDSAGNDNIQGKGGYDYIDAFRGGDDLLDGGSGQDVVLGRAGRDTVIGGDGADVVRGDGDDDAVYGEHQISLDDAVAANEAAGTGLQGDFAEGDAGDDTVVGGAGNDALLGGNGEDVIVGGAGDDNIDGDLETHFVSIAWGISRSIVTQADGSTLYAQQYSYVTFDYPTVGGDDVIFAGAGNDWVIARFGDDYVDGGSGDDVLFGDAGNDEVIGGAGDDRVFGDSSGVPVDLHGDDYLDGGEGNDQIFGYGGSDDMFGGSGNDSMYGDGSDIATSGDDYMDGEDGDDSMFGGAKDDQMFGGAGDDTIVGDRGSSTGTGDGDDSLSGEDGDDLLIGEGGKDTLDGGDGKDQIAGDHGGSDPSGDDDLIFGGAGNDTIDGQGGNDSIDAGADNDLVAGGEGNDSIFGGDGADQLQGGKGDDQLDGGSGDDTLFGQDGNDTITGGDGSDLMIGGAGDDVVIGGTGNNFYYWDQGDGNDTISDSGGDDWLVFNDIGLGQVGLGVASLKLMLPGGASIDLTDFDPDNPNGPGGIEHFFFAPQGVSYTKQQLIQALGGFKPTGTPGPDTLSGTALNDTMHGLESDDVLAGRAGNDQMFGDAGDDDLRGGDGNDSISGGDGDDIIQGDNGNDTLLGDSGNDILTGGAGNDVLLGGQGNDVYVFIRGDGQDTAVDTAGVNRVALGGDLTLDAVLFGRSMNDLTVTIKGTTDKLTIKDWFTTGSTFSDVMVADGQSLDHAAVDANMPTNLPPSTQSDAASVIEDSVLSASGNALANDNDPEGHALRLTNAGSYVGMYGTLTLQANGTYAYTLANGSAAVQSIGANQVGTDTFTYMVTDDDSTAPATAEGTIVVSVHGTNDAPAVIGDAASVVEGGAALSGNVLANDHDVDAGTTLFIAGSGTGIGGWGTLTLHADGSWTYQLANGTNAVESLGAGQSVTDTFTFNVSDGIAEVSESLVITVFGEDDAPFISQPISDQVAAANTRWTWQVPGTSFGDIDFGDTLSYGAAQTNGTALPSWLTFDPVTHTFDGRVPKGTTGSIDIRVTATDKSGLAISDVFNLSFSGSKGGGGGGGGGGGKGGGSGGGSGGNEGPGNGEDPPPPGHTYNFNDGPGTSPGSPGARGGNGYVPPPQALTPPALIDVQGQLPATPAVPASDSDGAQAFLVGVNGALFSESYAI